MKFSYLIPGLIVLVLIALGGVYLFQHHTAAPTDTTSTQEQTQDTGSASTTVTTGGTATSYTLAQISTHADRTSCYTTINGKVYDLTSWINQHPGGQQAILSLCGKDGTSAFMAQHGGQGRPEAELANLYIGTLAQ